MTPLRPLAALTALVLGGLAITACSSSNTSAPSPAQVKDAVSARSGAAVSAAAEAATPATTPAEATTPATTPAPAPATPAPVAAADGKQIFTANCASCHTLKAAGAAGQVGPNLDTLKPAAASLVRQVTNGGGGMPAFAGQLSAAEIKAVATYVASSAGA